MHSGTADLPPSLGHLSLVWDQVRLSGPGLLQPSLASDPDTAATSNAGMQVMRFHLADACQSFTGLACVLIVCRESTSVQVTINLQTLV